MAHAALIVLLLATAGLYTPVLWHGYVYEDQRMFVSSTTWRVPSRALTLTSFPGGLPNPMRAHAVNVRVHLVTGLALAGAVVTMGTERRAMARGMAVEARAGTRTRSMARPAPRARPAR